MIKMNDKLNKTRGMPYVIDEEIMLVDGKYENYLMHDNVDIKTINVYSKPKLTGEQILTYTVSNDSDMAWKTYISINSSNDKVYVSYETIGDTVEAEDINIVQNNILEVNENLLDYKQKNDKTVKGIGTELEEYKSANDDVISNIKRDIDEYKSSNNTKVDKNIVDIGNLKDTKIDISVADSKYATKTELNNAASNHTHDDRYYTKNEVNIRIQKPITWSNMRWGL